MKEHFVCVLKIIIDKLMNIEQLSVERSCTQKIILKKKPLTNIENFTASKEWMSQTIFNKIINFPLHSLK